MTFDSKQTITGQQLAGILGLSVGRIHQLVKERVITKEKRNCYVLETAIQDYIKYQAGKNSGGYSKGEGYQEEKARLTKLQADKAHLEVETISGNLVPADDVARRWYQTITNTKNRLLTVPSKAAPIVASETEAGIVQDIIDDLVREALEELVEYESS
jgi:phage terminase Nu1 subunit (DNA packaging protein)